MLRENLRQWREELEAEIFKRQILLFAIADQINPQERLMAFQIGVTELLIRPFLPEELFFRLSSRFIENFYESGQTKRSEASRIISNFYAQLDSLEPQVISQKMLDFMNNVLHVEWISLWWYNRQEEESGKIELEYVVLELKHPICQKYSTNLNKLKNERQAHKGSVVAV